MMNHRRRMLMKVGPALPPKTTLQNTSWANIAIVAAAGKAAEYWTVGDTKTIALGSSTFGSTSITVRIAAFDYDDLADGSGKAPITFDMTGVFATSQQFHNYANNAGGWGSFLIRATLISTLLPKLQTALGNGVIKPVYKYTSAGSQSSTINTTTDSVWIMSEYEVFGTTTYSVAGEKPTDKSACYPWFTDASSRIKKVGTVEHGFWLRSPQKTNNTSVCLVNDYGGLMTSSLGNTGYVAIGFCV